MRKSYDAPLKNPLLGSVPTIDLDTTGTLIFKSIHDSSALTIQIAVEGLRIALNNAGRLPIKNMGSSNRTEVQFSQLSSEDKSYALMADLLRSQARKFKNIVAVVDASSNGPEFC